MLRESYQFHYYREYLNFVATRRGLNEVDEDVLPTILSETNSAQDMNICVAVNFLNDTKKVHIPNTYISMKVYM